MHQCYVDPAIWSDSEILLPSESEHHLVHVLRVAAGEMISIFDGRGRHAVARVAIEKGRKAILRVEESSFVARTSPCISLLQAIPKGSHMDLIVEKATELGCGKIYPVMTDRVVLRISEEKKKEERRERWQRIAINAAEQSGVKWIPDVKSIVDISKVVAAVRQCDVFIVGSLGADARPFREVLGEVRAGKAASVALLVGPEGDLTPVELKMARDAGAIPVSFGSNIFRVETAALYGLSVLSYELCG